MRLVTRGTALWGIGALALAVWSCETTRNPGGIQRDVTPPAILLVNTVGDTQDIASGLNFGIQAVDNLALKSVSLRFSGGLIAIVDTNFTGTVKTYAVARQITFGPNSGVGGNIQIIGRATDGAGNFAEDTITIFLNNVQALRVQRRQSARLDRERPAGRCHRHPEFGYCEDRVPRVTGVQRDQPDDAAQRLACLHSAVRRFGGVRRHADRRSLQRDVQRRRLCGRLGRPARFQHGRHRRHSIGGHGRSGAGGRADRYSGAE